MRNIINEFPNRAGELSLFSASNKLDNVVILPHRLQIHKISYCFQLYNSIESDFTNNDDINDLLWVLFEILIVPTYSFPQDVYYIVTEYDYCYVCYKISTSEDVRIFDANDCPI